jgi:small subunit ribosomal protein S8
MVGDKVSNLINGLKNASTAGKDVAVFPHTKMSESILALLKKQDYITDYEVKENDSVKKELAVEIKYNGKAPAINGVKRISKFSKRIYRDVKSISPVKRGYGIMVLSTSKGLMTGDDAKKQNVGGESLFQIW